MNKKLENFYQFYNNIFEAKNNKEKNLFENKLNNMMEYFEEKNKEEEISNEEILDFLDLLLDFFENEDKYLEKEELLMLKEEILQLRSLKILMEEEIINNKKNNSKNYDEKLLNQNKNTIILDGDSYDLIDNSKEEQKDDR